MAKRAPEDDRPPTDEMPERTDGERRDAARDDAKRGPEIGRDETFDPSSRGDESGEVM
jgi:hypothetical protein